MFYQKPDKDREHVGGRADKAVKKHVRRDAASHNCSMSFVIHTILARYYDVHIEETYDGIKRTEPSTTSILRRKRKNQISRRGKA